jgi:hypothetical protein
MEASPGIEPGCADLQSATSPLRHEATPSARLLWCQEAGRTWENQAHQAAGCGS